MNITNPPVTVWDQIVEWYVRLRPKHVGVLVGLLVFLMIWLGTVRERERQNSVMNATAEQVEKLERLMQAELRASAEHHGRVLQRLERLEALHPSTDQEKDAK